MAYQTYITEAIVCGSTASHTSDKSYLLFTRELGMLYASAKSVREERSKQRYALQEFSRPRITLISGKAGWKVAGVDPGPNLYSRTSDRLVRGSIRSIILLLRRVLQGNIQEVGLYDDVCNALETLTRENAEMVERIVKVRVLFALGYVAQEPHLNEVLADDIWSRIPSYMPPEEKEYQDKIIASALSESQL